MMHFLYRCVHSHTHTHTASSFRLLKRLRNNSVQKHILVSEYCFSLKGTRAPWRSAWAQIWGKKCPRRSQNIFAFQIAKELSETPGVVSEGFRSLCETGTMRTIVRKITAVDLNASNMFKSMNSYWHSEEKECMNHIGMRPGNQPIPLERETFFLPFLCKLCLRVTKSAQGKFLFIDEFQLTNKEQST